MVEIAVQVSNEMLNESIESCPCSSRCFNNKENGEYLKADIVSLLQRIERLEKHCYGLKQVEVINDTSSEETGMPELLRVNSALQDTTDDDIGLAESSWDCNDLPIPELTNVASIKRELTEIEYDSTDVDIAFEIENQNNKRRIENGPATDECQSPSTKRFCIRTESAEDEVSDETNTKEALNKVQSSLDKVTKMLMKGLTKMDRRFDYIETHLPSPHSLNAINEKDDNMVKLWPGTSIDKHKYIALRAKKNELSDFTNSLLRMIYPRKLLANCSVTGKGNNRHKTKPVKPKLPHVDDVMDFIQRETCADRYTIKRAMVYLFSTEARRTPNESNPT